MRVRHTDSGPEWSRALDVVSSPGDIVVVSPGIAQRLVERTYFEAVDCLAVTSNGDTCGRELPCRYHTDEEGDE